MSAKQTTLQLIGQLPNNATWNDILAVIEEARATEEALRRFDERGGIPDEDVTDEEWLVMISRCWADDWSDPREDIYSLEDGRPETST